MKGMVISYDKKIGSTPDYLLLRFSIELGRIHKVSKCSLTYILGKSISKVVRTSHETDVGYFIFAVALPKKEKSSIRRFS